MPVAWKEAERAGGERSEVQAWHACERAMLGGWVNEIAKAIVPT